MEEPRPGGDYGDREEGRPEREGWRAEREGGKEGELILSSTGTTELSCHGERGAAGRARGGWRSHMPEGRRPRRANPTVLWLQPPPTGPLGPGQQSQEGNRPDCNHGHPKGKVRGEFLRAQGAPAAPARILEPVAHTTPPGTKVTTGPSPSLGSTLALTSGEALSDSNCFLTSQNQLPGASAVAL